MFMTGRNEKTRKTLVGDAREVVATCVALSVRAAERRITGFLDKRLGGTGLSAAQFALMVHVAAASDDTITALAARLGLDQSTLSRSLRALERAGLVEKARDPPFRGTNAERHACRDDLACITDKCLSRLFISSDHICVLPYNA
jgi:DNA-binding transcriptional ArsR family regulator